MIEFDGHTFKTSHEKDAFIQARETRRVDNLRMFKDYNRYNHNMAPHSEIGVFASTESGPRGTARMFVFNEDGIIFKMQESKIFKQAYPDFEWDTTKPQKQRKTMPESEWKVKADGLVVSLTSKARRGEKSPFAGMGLPEMLKAQKEGVGV